MIFVNREKRAYILLFLMIGIFFSATASARVVNIWCEKGSYLTPNCYIATSTASEPVRARFNTTPGTVKVSGPFCAMLEDGSYAYCTSNRAVVPLTVSFSPIQSYFMICAGNIDPDITSQKICKRFATANY